MRFPRKPSRAVRGGANMQEIRRGEIADAHLTSEAKNPALSAGLGR